jgi:phenylacetate-coenzyme A ligase PaaK-like adenylate-forming protein
VKPHSQPEHKLSRYLRKTVLPFSAYYRELFRKRHIDPRSIRTRDDLRRIPFTTKEDISGDPNKLRQFVLIPDRALLARRPSTIAKALIRGRRAVARDFEHEFRPLMLTSTTGRSSGPLPFIFTAHDIANLRIAGLRLMRVCAADREMRIINMFPFAPHLAFWLTHYAGTEFGAFVVSTGGGKTMGTDGNLRLIGRVQPDVIIGMPTFLYHVLREALETGVRCPKLRKLVLGGEKAPLGMRRKLRELAARLGAGPVDVLATYGFTEAKMAFAECPTPADVPPSGYHLYPDLGLIEIIDPDTGEPVGEGEPGEIVFTPLDARGTVVLRYRTGDLISGGMVGEPCPHCGRTVPRLVGSISRRSEVREIRLDKLKGTLVDFNRLEHVLDNTEGAGAWQLELRKVNDDPLDLDELILHVENSTGRVDAELAERIREQFAAEAEIHPNRIEFHDMEELKKLQGVGAQLKEQRLVDHRPKGEEIAV